MATDRYGLVLVLLLLTYVLACALPDGAWPRAVLAVAQGITVLVALGASDTPKPRRRAAALAVSVAVAIAVITAIVGGHAGGVAELISAFLLIGSFAAIVRRIAHHDHVSSQTLLGAVCCYVLFGLIYAFLYAGLARLGSGPFLSPAGSESLSNYVFFSFTTLTTTGYGNLIPATGVGRALSMIEALTGQLFLVTVVARLVALWIPTRAGRNRPG
ncbi:MAG: ion channel [Solirubrobacteraceae bacterium]